MKTRRLSAADGDLARGLFTLMAEVFEEESERLSDSYLAGLLGSRAFWAIAAFEADKLIGGITAHTLPMTRAAVSEIFIYDIAVHRDHQRRGVGRALVASLREAVAAEGIHELFVPADNDDLHALDFYRALGGQAAAVTIFTFSGQDH